MEQRIDPEIRPEYAVGKDPAYVPGLVAPAPAGAEVTPPEQTEEETPEEVVPQDVLPEKVPEDIPEDETAPEEEADPGKTEEHEEDGPAFEAGDRRGSITADRDGLRFRLDDQEAEFRWDELKAVEIKSPRFGRRFTVTAYLSTRRWFDAEVEAGARSQLKEWTAELDTVLDAYFEAT